jgi:Zn-dependent M28 family amino/carboxypeptidase
MIGLPGRSYSGPPLPLTSGELALRDALERHVHYLAGRIGERNVYRAGAYDRAARYIHDELAGSGYAPNVHRFEVDRVAAANIDTERSGSTDEILVIGAHYDSVSGCPGANDNASGVAALIELARIVRPDTGRRTIRFVAFANEEPPFFMTDAMGSVVYARACRARGERIVGMFSLETIGYYTSDRGSQQYPGPALFHRLYPDMGNFIGFVSNFASRRLMREAGREFRRRATFPSEGVAAPAGVPGIGWSDHWSFWQQGYPAVMITDTAPYRYPHYHQVSDTPDKLNYDSYARVVMGLAHTFSALAS